MRLTAYLCFFQLVFTSLTQGQDSALFLASGLGVGNSDLVDLNTPGFNCGALTGYPIQVTGSVGTYFNKKPTICAGNIYDDGVTPNECYEYDLTSNSWSVSDTRLVYGRWFPSAVEIPGNRWLVTGGSQAGLGGGTFYGSEIRDSLGNFAEALDLDMPEPKEDHCLIQLSDTETMIIGGGPITNTVWIYDWTTQYWSRQDPLQTGRRGHACAKTETPLGTRVIVAGGVNRDFLNTVEIFDPETRSWSFGPPLPKVLYGSRMYDFEGRVYMVGGTDDLYSLTDVYVMDPITFEWSENEVLLPGPREVFVGISVPLADVQVC